MALTIDTANTTEQTSFKGLAPEVIEVPFSYGATDTYTTGGATATIADFIGENYTGVCLGGHVVDPTEAAKFYNPRFNSAGTKLMLYDGNAELANTTTLASYTGVLRFARW